MYHDMIYDFQRSLYNLFINDSEIKLEIEQIYFSVVQDAKYPFLLINILNIENMSVFKQNIVKIDFEICIFTSDKNRNNLFLFADKIINKINEFSFELPSVIMASIKADSMKLQNGKDLVSSKLIINYQALLKQKEI